jgi:hypothetical protein
MIASATLACALLPSAAHSESWVGRSVTLAGRKVQCGRAEIMLDRELPSEGGAADDFLILNPDMLNEQPPAVRLFVFAHECGHLSVGDGELDADCAAVQTGVRERWLDRKGLDQVCQSFEGAPETPTHPSAERRCQNLDRCFAAVIAERTIANKRTPELPVRKTVAATQSKALSAWRCADPPTATALGKDPIADLIAEDGRAIARCH